MSSRIMPNSKPQVMWMAKRPNGSLVPLMGVARIRREMVDILTYNYGPYRDLRKKGWRIVKVEVRETKKGKKG